MSILLLKVIKDPYQAVLLRALLALCIVVAFKSFNGSDSRVLRFLGKYATIMYLTHVLLLVLLPKIVYYPRYSVLVFVFFAILCLAFAIVIDWLKKVTRYEKLRLTIVNSL